jgi:hypothetical protein
LQQLINLIYFNEFETEYQHLIIKKPAWGICQIWEDLIAAITLIYFNKFETEYQHLIIINRHGESAKYGKT